jgi:hypothetical protein
VQSEVVKVASSGAEILKRISMNELRVETMMVDVENFINSKENSRKPLKRIQNTLD